MDHIAVIAKAQGDVSKHMHIYPSGFTPEGTKGSLP